MGYKCPEDSNPADYYISIMHQNNIKNIINFPLYFKSYEE